LKVTLEKGIAYKYIFDGTLG